MAPAAPALAQDVRYEIQAYDVVGVKTLSAAEIERAVYPFAGPDRSNEDIDKARAAVEAAYKARGLEAVLVDLPPQDPDVLRQGIVTIRVNEVPVSRVRVTESKYHTPGNVRAAVPSLAVGQPLDLRALQRDLEVANRYPDREIIPSFRPGLIPGTVEVELRVRSKLPLHGSVELNDDSSPNTDDLRLAASLRYSDLWSLGHTVGANYVVAPQDPAQQEVFAASYTAPILGTPWTILVSGFTSNSNVAALGGTNVLGNGYQVGVRGIYRLPGSLYQTLGIGVDFKNFDQDILIDGVLASRAPIMYLPLSIDYAAARETEHTSFEVNAGLTLGLRTIKRQIGTDCRDRDDVPIPCPDQFDNRSFNARENFLRFTLGTTYTVTSKKDFIGIFRLNGQIADSPLVTNEQFGVGGQTSVRGYFVSEAIGDEGVNFSAQGETPSFLAKGIVDELRLFGFSDFGYVRVQTPLPGQDDDFRLLSIGAGVRLRLFEHFTGQAIFAAPLLDGPLTRTGQPRFTFSARGEF